MRNKEDFQMLNCAVFYVFSTESKIQYKIDCKVLIMEVHLPDCHEHD